MSLFGDLAGSVLNSALSGTTAGSTPAATQSQLVPAVMELINQHGGVSGLVQQLQSGGLGGAVQSWIGSGANQPVTAEQITQALNAPAVAQFAQRIGVNPAEVGPVLAQLLPVVVDHLTPNGQVGEHNVLGELAGSLLHSKLFG
jgi:uncharacterized protein YidB (DUF937 family)